MFNEEKYQDFYMIESTFQILPSVGGTKEKKIWDSGIRKWNEFISCEDIPSIPKKNKERFDSILNYAYELLNEYDCRGLAGMLKGNEHWRLFNRFSKSVAYLDIETDGLDRDSLVTVVTVHKNNETTTLVEGFDLNSETLSEAIGDASMFVTYNGSCFDIPVLRCSFPDVDLDLPHYDLRFACRKVGFKGGLKSIEKEIGICRDDDIIEIDGFEAVRLWKRWERNSDRKSLETLVEYNRADTVNLEKLANITYEKLVKDYAGFPDA